MPAGARPKRGRGRSRAASPASEALNTAPSSVCSVTATCSSLAGHRHGELVACRRRRGTARRTSACRCAPGPARRGGRGRRAGRRRCCAPRRPSPAGSPSRSKHQKTLIGLKQWPKRARRCAAIRIRAAGRSGRRRARRGTPSTLPRSVACGRPEVVARLEPRQQAVVGQVVEVDQPGVRAVGERALERLAAGVPDGGPVDRGRDLRSRRGRSEVALATSDPARWLGRSSHAKPSRSAAASPERAPSSWKPQPW